MHSNTHILLLLLLFLQALIVVAGSVESPPRLRRSLIAPRSTAGAAAGISAAGVNKVLASVEPMLEQSIAHLHIPDFRNKHVHLQNMRTQGFQCHQPCISVTMGGGGALRVQLNSFDLGFHVRYKVKEFITLQGACDMHIRHAKASAFVSVSASGGQLHLGAVQANINVGRLDTGCHGITGGVINLLERLFQSVITSTIRNAGEGALKKGIQHSLSKALSGISWTLPFNDGVVADFAPESIESSPASFSLRALGVIRPALGDDAIVPFRASAPASLPAWDTSGNRLLQIMVSDYAFESAGSTYFNMGRLQRTLTSKNVPELNTDFMSLVAPGLKKQYGSEKHPMQLRLYMSAAPTMQTTSGKGAHAAADLRLEFSVIPTAGQGYQDNTEESSMALSVAKFLGLVPQDAGVVPQVAFTLGGHASCGLSFDITTTGAGQLLQAEIEQLDLGTWAVESSSVGAVNLVDGLLDVISKLIQKFAVPEINAVLKKGMPLPSAQNLHMKNTVLKPRDGYVLVASDFDFSL